MKKLIFILLLSPLLSLAQTELVTTAPNEIPMTAYYLGALIVSLIVMYFIIKLAVRSALMEIENMKWLFAKKEYERLNTLLSENRISKEEYNQRSLNIPLKALHEFKS